MLKYFNIEIIDNIVRYLIYFLVIIGAWMIGFPLMQPLFKRKNKFKKINSRVTKKNGINKHIERLLAVTFNTKTDYAVYTFILISVLLFVFSFILLSKIGQELITKLGLSLIVSIIPYIFLKVKLYSIQVESSYEGEELLGELASQYKINYFNMNEAIPKTINRLKRSPYTSKALFRLATQLPMYKTEGELQELIEEFTFSIGTEWGILLGNNIKIALTTDELINEALDDIHDDLKDLNRIHEKYKQQNHESYMMIRFVTPISYVGSIYVMFKFFAFDLNKFIDYQFKNPMGFKFFVITFLLMIINYMVYLIMRRPKNDF